MKLNTLNDEQIKIVRSKYKQLLITAGAGSGKTKILIYRFLWLLLKHKNPLNSFIIITFAYKAAQEIKNRIIKYINNKNIINLYLGTFHSIAYKIIKESYKINNLKFKYKILNEKNQLLLIKQLINEEKIISEVNCYDIQNYINTVKELGENFCKNYYFINYYISIFNKYQTLCNKLFLLDFSELLIKANNLFLDSKIKNYYKNTILNILIDEFQDINFLQYQLFKNLFFNQNILVVGDDDQSIYGWRGAIDNNFNKLKKDIPNIKIYKLEQNYRSTYSIIYSANKLIKYNINRINKKLWTNNNIKNFIYIYKANNEIDEVNFIFNNINLIIKNNNKIKSIAILYRNNFQSIIIKKKIFKFNIFTNNHSIITSIINILFFILNFNNDKYFLLLINIPLFSLSKKILNKIKIIKKKKKKYSYWKILNKINKKYFIYKFKIIKIISIIKNIILKFKVLNLPKKIFYLIKIFKKKIYLDSKILNLLKIFIQKVINVYDQNIKNNKYNLYYKKYFLDIKFLLNFILNNNKININFLSIHKSKGLEFDQVFIIGMEQGLFPLYTYKKDIFLLEEERRLAYVAVTRAKFNLFITWCKNRKINNIIKHQYPSIFINELHNKYVYLLNFSFKINNKIKYINNNKKKKYKKVIHDILGKGLLIKIINIDNLKFFVINFKNKGIKNIIYNYPNLHFYK